MRNKILLFILFPLIILQILYCNKDNSIDETKLNKTISETFFLYVIGYIPSENKKFKLVKFDNKIK